MLFPSHSVTRRQLTIEIGRAPDFADINDLAAF
jgi:hypothetical protein